MEALSQNKVIPPGPNRRFPRRQYQTKIGVLLNGNYSIAPCVEIGEGGLLLQSEMKLKVGDLVVMSFFLPELTFVSLQGEVVYFVPEVGSPLQKFGLKFKNLPFEAKRKIRDYIAHKPANES